MSTARMARSSAHFLGGLLFLLAGAFVLTDFQPVWWSIATVVVVFTAAAVFFLRSVLEWRKSHTPETRGSASELT
ncbi:NADH:ubiquinone oxidoreductase subunit 6 (subunit J) [Microbacterium trichothecenolyticum]|uniref:hypothetical protein n=1 Tax=Microbacterium trichothecenolyticum TaxID=69370 RepID=UPI00285A93F1|nr:hypothetical protein [Microbacterium trichothecenolyticum]MDR7113470.1 NADH:ubiquinone oxidoreductase subunit 6 (subunit J) [Microbacterium trichothecenolyticum]